MMIDELLFIAVRGIGAGALFGLIAMSFNIVRNSSTVLNFAQGNMLVLGGLAAMLFAKNGMSVPPWLWIAYLIGTAHGSLSPARRAGLRHADSARLFR